MRTFILAMAAIVGLMSQPALADHHSHTVVSFGFGYGYPYPAPYPYGFYRPYYGYGPWAYPTIGIGVGVAPYPRHSEQKSSGGAQQQQAFKLYVYPSAGQSESQMAEDRYQCHVWAAGQSGYDPTLGAGKREDADGYTRAFTACMQGRNYVVK